MAGILENARGAVASAQTLAGIVRVLPQLATPAGVQTFLNAPNSVRDLLGHASTIASNAENPLVTGAVERGFVTGVSQIVRTFDSSNHSDQAARTAAQQLIGLAQRTGGPALSACGRAMTQCLNTPAFTRQLNAVQGDGAALVREIGRLNSQINEQFPIVGQATQLLNNAGHGLLNNAANILGLPGFGR